MLTLPSDNAAEHRLIELRLRATNPAHIFFVVELQNLYDDCNIAHLNNSKISKEHYKSWLLDKKNMFYFIETSNIGVHELRMHAGVTSE